MIARPNTAPLLLTSFGVFVVMLLQGCGSGFPTPTLFPVREVPAAQSAIAPSDFEPGLQQAFADATIVAWDGRGPVVFSVQVPSQQEIHVWDLGPIAARTRLSIELSGHACEVSIGLFDAIGAVQLLAGNHGGRTELFESWQAAGDLERLYLVVVSWRTGTAPSSYSARLAAEPGDSTLAAQHQVVALNFDGAAAVSIGNSQPIDVPPFVASDLHPDWGSQRDFMMDQVLAVLEEIYSGMAVDFRFVSDPAIAGEDGVTVLHFGSWHPNRVGVADRVDYGNRFRNEQAVIHAENFAKYVDFGFGVEEIARGMANVAAHELGHLLGLNHTVDPGDVMNVSPTVFVLMGQHYFRPLSGLDPVVFPLGVQDGAGRVFEVVAGDWGAVLQARRLAEAQTRLQRRTPHLPAEIDALAPLNYGCIAQQATSSP